MGRFISFFLVAVEVAVLALAGALVQGLPTVAAQPPGAALTNVLGPEETVPLAPAAQKPPGSALTNVIGPEVTLFAPQPETVQIDQAAEGGKNLRKLQHKLLQEGTGERPS